LISGPYIPQKDHIHHVASLVPSTLNHSSPSTTSTFSPDNNNSSSLVGFNFRQEDHKYLSKNSHFKPPLHISTFFSTYSCASKLIFDRRREQFSYRSTSVHFFLSFHTSSFFFFNPLSHLNARIPPFQRATHHLSTGRHLFHISSFFLLNLLSYLISHISRLKAQGSRQRAIRLHKHKHLGPHSIFCLSICFATLFHTRQKIITLLF
jgi:hypothetical protein